MKITESIRGLRHRTFKEVAEASAGTAPLVIGTDSDAGWTSKPAKKPAAGSPCANPAAPPPDPVVLSADAAGRSDSWHWTGKKGGQARTLFLILLCIGVATLFRTSLVVFFFVVYLLVVEPQLEELQGGPRAVVGGGGEAGVPGERGFYHLLKICFRC